MGKAETLKTLTKRQTMAVVIRVRDERIIPARGCVVGRELLMTCGLLWLLSTFVNLVQENVEAWLDTHV